MEISSTMTAFHVACEIEPAPNPNVAMAVALMSKLVSPGAKKRSSWLPLAAALHVVTLTAL